MNTGAFRPAPERSAAINVFQTLLQSAAVWTLFLLFLPIVLLRLEASLGWATLSIPMKGWIGWGLFSIASLVNLWTGLTLAVVGRGTPLPMKTARSLVTTGPYSSVRNPMALAGILQGVGIGVYLGSWSVLTYALLGGVVWHHWVRPAEEHDLMERFGEDYILYRKRVGLWIPTSRARTSPVTSSQGPAIGPTDDQE